MDVEATDVRTLDVFRRVSQVSFCYFSDEEIRSLSVAPIVHEVAFDDLGRPVPGGLYDRRLGPGKYSDGNCVTCGLSYRTCPGHFGHVSLPFPLVRPHLINTLYRFLRSACWHCGRVMLVERRKLLILARLRFEHVGLHKASAFVKAYRFSALDSHSFRGRPPPGVTADEFTETLAVQNKSVSALLDSAPSPISEALEDVDRADQKAVDAAIASAAEQEWSKAADAGTLLEKPGAGWKEEAEAICGGKTGSGRKCPCCGEKSLAVVKEGGSFWFGSKAELQSLLGPIQLQDQVKRVWESERAICELVYGLKGRRVRRGLPPVDHSLFFVREVLVSPTRFRPTSTFGETGLASEHPQNVFFQQLLQKMEAMVQAQALKEASNADVDTTKEAQKPLSASEVKEANARHVIDMQQCLMELYDSPGGDRNKNGGAMGIRQQLETKQGLFRMHMMGKRVNFSCRSVIGPDVFLDTNEVGIPESFAKLLTVSEPVTSLNVDEMRAAVLNGPDVYPGANAIEDWSRGGDLQVINLRSSANKKLLETQAKLLVRNSNVSARHGENGQADENRHDMANGGQAALPKRVLRHLKNGDIVLFNRQPTLHRVSMMAHKVRVLPGDRTIRFHYSNCRSYNADFDGDEMNIHVPQDDLARAEARNLMLSDNHYIAPSSGEPIRDLIQDHILASALISNRDTFFTRERFCNLLYSATERIMSRPGAGRFLIPTPAVLKPVRLWTGKQLLSSVLDAVRGFQPGLCLEGRSRVKADLVGTEEAEVLFRHGELLRGVLDKNAFGASKFGIVHAVQEAYGCAAAGEFLSAIGRLCTLFLREHGHTTGVDDLVLVHESDSNRVASLMKGIASIGREAVREVNKTFEEEGSDDCQPGAENDDESKRKAIDAAHVVETSQRSALKKARQSDELQHTRSLVEVLIRGKGAVAEARLDSAMTGRLNSLASEVNRNIPSGLWKRFPKNGFSLMTDTGAKGSAVNSTQISCLLGSTIMEGKRVPRMGGSGATLPCFAPFDPAPNAGGFIGSRFLTGIAPYEMFFHAMAGREGLLDTSLKTANSGYLQRCLIKHLEGVRVHYDYTARDSDGLVMQFLYGDDGIDPCKASWLMKKIPWQVENMAALQGSRKMEGKPPKPSKEISSLRKMVRKGRHRHQTVLESASPGALSKFGAVSNSFDEKIQTATAGIEDRKARRRAESFLYKRYLRAIAEPGDAVGVIAAHSVGEPSTQMTLNTFHHAGSESKHVTLGVPRLRELLMTASKYPKTPTMTLPLKSGLSKASAVELSRRMANVTLADLIEKVAVREGGVSFCPELGDAAVHRYTIILYFPEETLFENELGFGIAHVVDAVENEFVKKLYVQFARELKKVSVLAAKSSRKSAKATASGDVGTPAGENTVDDEVEAGIPSGSERKKKAGSAMVEEGDSDDGADENAEEERGSDMDDYGDDVENEGSEDGEKEAEQTGNSSSKMQDVSGEVSREHEIGEDLNVDESIQAWKESKARELKLAAQKKKKKKTKAGGAPQTNQDLGLSSAEPIGKDTVANTPNSDLDEMDESGGGLGTSLGITGDVSVAENGRCIELPWVLPQAMTGRLRIPELVREAADGVRLAFVDRITKCFTEDVDIDGEKRAAVATEGSNLTAALELGNGLVDMDRISTNDMYGILNLYGVEAMRAALIAEFEKIFDAYGIGVDLRHLSLISDYMTAQGGYLGFNRGSMPSVPSLFQQFSFETTMKFVVAAAMSGESDDVLRAPSTAISTGELYSGGTGSFEVLSTL